VCGSGKEERLDQSRKEEKCSEGHESGIHGLPEHPHPDESVEGDGYEADQHSGPPAGHQVCRDECPGDAESHQLDREGDPSARDDGVASLRPPKDQGAYPSGSGNQTGRDQGESEDPFQGSPRPGGGPLSRESRPVLAVTLLSSVRLTRLAALSRA